LLESARVITAGGNLYVTLDGANTFRGDRGRDEDARNELGQEVNRPDEHQII
jgi:hypothetical protein